MSMLQVRQEKGGGMEARGFPGPRNERLLVGTVITVTASSARSLPETAVSRSGCSAMPSSFRRSQKRGRRRGF